MSSSPPPIHSLSSAPLMGTRGKLPQAALRHSGSQSLSEAASDALARCELRGCVASKVKLSKPVPLQSKPFSDKPDIVRGRAGRVSCQEWLLPADCIANMFIATDDAGKSWVSAEEMLARPRQCRERAISGATACCLIDDDPDIGSGARTVTCVKYLAPRRRQSAMWARPSQRPAARRPMQPSVASRDQVPRRDRAQYRSMIDRPARRAARQVLAARVLKGIPSRIVLPGSRNCPLRTQLPRLPDPCARR